MANITVFGNKQWHNTVPNDMKVSIPLEMEKPELDELREKLSNAGMNFYGYISQSEDEKSVKISIPQKELDDFCRISGIENPVIEKLKSVEAVETQKRQKAPVGNTNYRDLVPVSKLNCDVETALLAVSRMEYQNKPVSMRVWSFEGDRAGISTNQSNFQALKAIINQIQQERNERPKEAEKEATPAPAKKAEPVQEQPAVPYPAEKIKELADTMLNNSCGSPQKDLQKMTMYGEPPKINSPLFNNKTVVDFRNGIDVNEKMGKELFEKQTGSFFAKNNITVLNVEEDKFTIRQGGQKFDVPFESLGKSVAEIIKEDYATDSRFQKKESEADMADVQLLYNAYRKHTETPNLPMSEEEKKHGLAIAERFLLVPENAKKINIEPEDERPFDTDREKIALALALSHHGLREKFTEYSLDVNYKKTLPQNVVEDIVNSAVEYKQLLSEKDLDYDAFRTEAEAFVANDRIEEYLNFYLKIAEQLQEKMQEMNFGTADEAEQKLNVIALAYALDDKGEIEFSEKEERLVEKEKTAPEKEQKQEAETAKEDEKQKPVDKKQEETSEKTEEAEEQKKPVSRRKKEEIKDFGRHIGGAKKEDFIGRFSINSEWSDKERQENINKNNIWQFGKKEHIALRDKGVPVEAIYYINKIKNGIEAKPYKDTPEEQESYVAFVNAIKKACEDVVADQNLPLDRNKAVADIAKSVVAEVEKMRSVENRTTSEFYVTKKFARAVNKTYGLTQDVKSRNFLASPEQKLENDIDKRFTIVSDETNRRCNNKTGFSVYDSKTRQFTDNFPTYDEARQFCRETMQNTKTTTDRKGQLRPPQLQHIVRTGEEYRNENEKITGEDIMERFHLYGGEFGNWENQQLRQTNLDMMYDALKDLAKVMNIKATDIGLDGDLGIAFGSRGRGSALAHYEPAKHVINLTRERGAGSLAHEYGHALDRFLNENLNVGKNYASEGSEPDNPMAKVMETIRYKRDEDGRLQRTDYFNNACKLAGDYSKTGNGYWNAPTEMFARAFACYVTDKLEEMGMKNTYLSGHSDFNKLTAPQGEERKAINQAIDNMLEQIKEKGLLQEPITEKAQELFIYTRENHAIADNDRSHIQLRGSFTKTDECTLDGKDYLVMQSEYDGKLALADKDGVVYDDNISVNYSTYDSLNVLVSDSICTQTANTISKETGIPEAEAFSALKELYENSTYDFDDMHYYCQNVHDKNYGDDFDIQYVEQDVIDDLQSAVKTVVTEKEQESEKRKEQEDFDFPEPEEYEFNID